MRVATALNYSRPLALTGALLLPGCALIFPSAIPTGPQAQVETASPHCDLLKPTAPVTGTDLDVLKATFARVRTGTLMLRSSGPVSTPQFGGDTTSVPEKAGAPVSHIDASALVPHSKDDIVPIQKTLADMQVVGSLPSIKGIEAPPKSVTEELSFRIPWLVDESIIQFTRQDPAASADAASAGLNLISFVTEKKSTLLKVNSEVGTTPFGSGDHQQLQSSLQKLVGLEPFHLITILAAKQIMAYLNAQTGPHHVETQELIDLVVIFNAADFLSTYFDEYFRGGQLLQVTVNEKTLEDDVVKQFNSKLNKPLTPSAETQIRAAVSSVCTKTSGACSSLPTLGSDGFTSIFGQVVQFGGVSIAFGSSASEDAWRPSVTAPSVGVFGPQMVQVLIEALFDANGPHPPAMQTSTACTKGLFKTDDEDKQCVTQPDANWSRINIVGNTTQAIVTTGVGAAIRGGNVAALNNEAVASIVETLAGVSTRKAVQQVMWICNAPVSAGVKIAGASK